jgi:Asp-tRNA(Asn)/Glu-tRNA(Gln) amidotransferase A subunit family amidase
VLDAAITMDIITRETDGERVFVSLEGLDGDNLNGMKVGVYWDYFNHADREIVDKCKVVLSELESLGVEIVEINIPELDSSRVAHFVTIVTEISQSLALDADKYFFDINLETLMLIGVGLQLTSNDYLNAQKQRARSMAFMEHIFNQVDVIITPTTACVAPPITSAAIPLGELDATTSGQLMRYSFLANLCGNPALTLPVGYTEGGLPIGVQLMGRCFEERVLFRFGLALENSGRFPLKKPQVFYDLLQT